MQQTQKRCFHCGRYLASCAQSGGYDCCNYCCILSNLLSETKEPKENTEVRDMFLLLFVVITVVLAVLMYYWKDEAIQLVRQAESVLRKLYLLVCYLPMSSVFVKNQMTIDSLGLRLSDGRGGKVLRSPSPNGNRRRRGSHSE